MCKIKIILPLLLIFISSCQAQQKEDTIDTLALVSRGKADKVLTQFDSLDGARILYSLKDEHYYVIIQNKNKFQEYYVYLDSGGRLGEIQLIESRRENKKTLSKAFESHKYHSYFKTDMPEATYVRGVPSYFVMKGNDGKRYGEYCLSSLTLPPPIEGEIYAYLITRLSEVMSSEK
jgi:hypothetical protein